MPRNPTEVTRVSTVLLWLLVIDLGVSFGAGLYEARIVVPDWLDTSGAVPEWNADVAREDDTGRRFWVGVTTLPLTLLVLANLVVGWRAPRHLRRWWLGTAVAALIERVFTLSYFVPTMVGLMSAESSPEAVNTAARWIQLNHVRHVIVLATWLAALRTFSLLYAYRGAASTGRAAAGCR